MRQHKRADELQKTFPAAIAALEERTQVGRAVLTFDQLKGRSQAYMTAREEHESVLKPEEVSKNRTKAMKMTAPESRSYIVEVFDKYSEFETTMIKEVFPGVEFDVVGIKKILSKQKNLVKDDAILLCDIVEWIFDREENIDHGM